MWCFRAERRGVHFQLCDPLTDGCWNICGCCAPTESSPFCFNTWFYVCAVITSFITIFLTLCNINYNDQVLTVYKTISGSVCFSLYVKLCVQNQLLWYLKGPKIKIERAEWTAVVGRYHLKGSALKAESFICESVSSDLSLNWSGNSCSSLPFASK